MAIKIVFTEDDNINGVPIKKGTEMSVSESIYEAKKAKGVVKEKTTTQKIKKEDAIDDN